MVFAQASGARSLRDLERVVERHHGVAAHLGLGGVKRSTLADANWTRPAALFEMWPAIFQATGQGTAVPRGGQAD